MQGTHLLLIGHIRGEGCALSGVITGDRGERRSVQVQIVRRCPEDGRCLLRHEGSQHMTYVIRANYSSEADAGWVR